MPENSVDCVVTSPPYWGLRKYKLSDTLWDAVNGCRHEVWGEEIIKQTSSFKGFHKYEVDGHLNPDVSKRNTEAPQGQVCQSCGAWKGQLGLEPKPELYLKHLVGIFEGVKRVLKPSGVCFVNLGDSYASGGKSGDSEIRTVSPKLHASPTDPSLNCQRRAAIPLGLKPKDLCLIPFRFAIAMQEAGWWVRSTIIWNKLNPMPESVKDRPTESHEYIFMFTKSASYFWDQEAVREVSIDPESYKGRRPRNAGSMNKYEPENYKFHVSVGDDNRLPSGQTYFTRNLRSVWTFPTQPYKKAHFATFPEKLPELCIKAACPERVCSKCGKPWMNVVEHKPMVIKRSERAKESGIRILSSVTMVKPAESKVIGSKPICECNTETEPGTVMDIFAGSGTVGWVAVKMGRRYILIEQSEEYIKLCQDRLRQQGLELT